MFSDQQQSALQVRENIYLNREKQVRIQKKVNRIWRFVLAFTHRTKNTLNQ